MGADISTENIYNILVPGQLELQDYSLTEGYLKNPAFLEICVLLIPISA